MLERIDTLRLVLRQAEPADAAFMVELLNDPAFLANIGDRGVRTTEAAAAWIAGRMAPGPGPLGMRVAAERESGRAIGTCGLLRRAELDAPDLGFAFLPVARGRGLAREAAEAALVEAEGRHGLDRLFAITKPGNAASERLLARLGFGYRETRWFPSLEKDTRVHLRVAGDTSSARYALRSS